MAWCSSRRRRFVALLAGCLLVSAFAGEARANEETKLDVAYEAAPGCPSRGEFDEQLRSRVPAGWLVGQESRRFEVRIVRESDGYSGRLDVRGVASGPTVREIRAPTCRAVSTAIAVFLALTLDPSSDDPTSSPRSDNAAPSATVDAARSRARPRVRARTAAPAPPLWSFGSGYRVTYLHAPEAAWGSRVHAELARASVVGSVGASLRLSWGFSNFSVAAQRAGDASFRLRTARAEGCARVASGMYFVSPCLGLDVGRLAASSPDLPGAGYASTTWTAVLGTVGAGLSPLSWLTIELAATMLVPLERTSFVLIEPYRTVYTAPAVLLEAAAGVTASARF